MASVDEGFRERNRDHENGIRYWVVSLASMACAN